jgi:glycosyltransferase involved in cell wall biosynthesis
MDKEPLVSVLMTAYNREQLIEMSIKSVLASDYSNFELIIVDDASSDGTVTVAQKYAALDTRVKVFVNPQNLGDYANRNYAATLASGVYLKYLDSDDYIYPWGLRIMVNMMLAFPHVSWGFCTSKVDFIYDGPLPVELSPRQAYEHHYLSKSLFNKSPLDVIIKRDLFFDEKGFLPVRMISDFEFWHRLAQKQSVLILPDGLIWYRRHPDQEINDYPRYMMTYENIRIRYLTAVDCPLDKAQVRLAFYKRLKGLKNQTFYFMYKVQLGAAVKNIKLIFLNLYHKMKYK